MRKQACCCCCTFAVSAAADAAAQQARLRFAGQPHHSAAGRPQAAEKLSQRQPQCESAAGAAADWTPAAPASAQLPAKSQNADFILDLDFRALLVDIDVQTSVDHIKRAVDFAPDVLELAIPGQVCEWLCQQWMNQWSSIRVQVAKKESSLAK